MECYFFFSTKKVIWEERVVEIHTIKVHVKILLNFYLWVWMMCVASHSCMWSRVCDTLGLLYLSQDKQVSVSTFSLFENVSCFLLLQVIGQWALRFLGFYWCVLLSPKNVLQLWMCKLFRQVLSHFWVQI